MKQRLNHMMISRFSIHTCDLSTVTCVAQSAWRRIIPKINVHCESGNAVIHRKLCQITARQLAHERDCCHAGIAPMSPTPYHAPPHARRTAGGETKINPTPNLAEL